MKPSTFISSAVLAFGVLFFASGCANLGRTSSMATTTKAPRSFALAVTVLGGGQPTPQQWAVVQSAFRRELAQMGYVLVDNLALADKIIRVEFIPDLDDPSTGHAAVLSVRNNTSYAYSANRSITPASYGYGFAGLTDPTRYYNNLYGYNDPYYGGSFSYTPPTYTPPTHGNQPPHSRPNNPADCPPGADRPPDNYAGNRPHRPTPSYDSGNYRSEPSYSTPSFPSYSDSYSSYTSSSYSPPPAAAESTPTTSSYSSSHDVGSTPTR